MRPLLLCLIASICWGDPTQILTRRCLSCHNSTTKMGRLSLASRSDAERVLSARMFERIDQGEMPPGGGLPSDERDELKSWLKAGAPWEGTLAIRPRAGSDWWSLQPIQSRGSSIDQHIETALQAKGLKISPPADRATLIRRVTFDLIGLPPTPAEIQTFLADSSKHAYEKLIDRLLASPSYGERWGRHWLDVIRYGESHGYEQNHVRPNAWPFRDYVINAFNRDLPFNRFIQEQLAGDVLAPGDAAIHVATGFLVAGPHDTVGNSNLAATRQQRADDLDDIVNATASAFLGLTVNCARCHDHKFDPILQADYYRVAAVFAGVNHAERSNASAAARAAREQQAAPLEEQIKAGKQRLDLLSTQALSNRSAAEAVLRSRLRAPVSPFGTEETLEPIETRYLRISAPQGFPGGLDEIEVFSPDGRNLTLASTITVSSTRIADGNPGAYHARHLNDGAFDRRWFPEGNGPAAITIELSATTLISKVGWSTDRARAFQGKFQQNTLSNYEVAASLDGLIWTTLATSENRLPPRPQELDRLIALEALPPDARAEFLSIEQTLKTLEASLKKVPALPLVYAGILKQPTEPVYLLKGGNVMLRGEPIAPASLSTLRDGPLAFNLSLDSPEQERRLKFAQWISDDANPLTPRVVANRLWHYHFGRGIVATPSDFGYNGERPTHPELLDYLAQRLITNGWHLKPLHREILLSAAYRQSSAPNAAAAKIDADSRLLWRFPPQRLEAEALRDSMLSVAGVLDPQAGGPSFRLYNYTVDNVATYFPLDKFGPETYRRSVYAESARSIRNELLSVFDCPDSSLPEPRRVSTTSPLQALSLLNHSFTIDMSEAFTRRLAATPEPQRITQAFLLAFGRPPEPAELTRSQTFILAHGMTAFARALFNANEFLYVY